MKDAAGKERRVGYFPLEFQISKKQWEFYELDRGVVPPGGIERVPDFRILRNLVQRIYERRDSEAFSRMPLRAGQLNAAGLINEIFRCIIRVYIETRNPRALERGLSHIGRELTPAALGGTLEGFVDAFPPLEVLRGKRSSAKYLKSSTLGIPNREIVAAEILLLHLANGNPAFSPCVEFFNDSDLAARTDYGNIFRMLEKFLTEQPGLGSGNAPLPDFLRQPIAAGGESLAAQLQYIKDNWRQFIPEHLFYRLLTALDILKEEEKMGLLGRGPNLVLSFKDLSGYPEYARYGESEYERFTEDRDWMAKVVLLAKSVHVWLDQLSKKYGREIARLDQIPDEELDTLSRWGFTGLWLIGIWERSPASQKIKRICGNPEALSSAYSVFDYEISRGLGGEDAWRNLKERARARGIRLATDIVPNHMGIYSRWVIEHPERFIQLDHPPFPGYSFTGQELSDDPRVSIKIEDGYWARRDAAVVFMRHDRWTGETRYIYHGNDGTSMPWNDTAQLDFIKADVREAVIRLILGVARQFQIIRLDAAMTLARRHFQRLWYPHPGTGGGIPSRAESGMLAKDFDALMPEEFWREVVDRVNREVPDTLLLAEAFWLMEGYFVRTLGMHRVYNSAFMNMLKMEENDKYRSVIKNVLEFDPRILKRFVNFMNNPDEQTAVAQFGKGDKYFGVCLMMVTMPGLPMFGHGQIEGFAEKYGMEYGRAYWNETPDGEFVKRHEAEIFPLMGKRHLFSDVENFLLYDFYAGGGSVNENVFAYSNMRGNERAVIVYHNKYAGAEGWIRTSCGFCVNPSGGDRKKIAQKTLAEGLALKADPDHFYIFRDYKAGLEYIRSGSEMASRGLYLKLRAFQYCVFMNFREVKDGPAGHFSALAHHLGGRGVPDIDEALRELMLAPVHAPLETLIGRAGIDALLGEPAAAQRALGKNAAEFVREVKRFTNAPGSEKVVLEEIMSGLKGVAILEKAAAGRSASMVYLRKGFEDRRRFLSIALPWIAVRGLGKLRAVENPREESVALMDELLMRKVISKALEKHGLDSWNASCSASLVRILTAFRGWYDASSEEITLHNFKAMLDDQEVQLYLGFNRYDGELWFNKERMETLLYWLFASSALDLAEERKTKVKITGGIKSRYRMIHRFSEASSLSGWCVARFRSILS